MSSLKYQELGGVDAPSNGKFESNLPISFLTEVEYVRNILLNKNPVRIAKTSLQKFGDVTHK